MFAALLITSTAVCVVLLLHAEHNGETKRALVFKTLASLTFVLLGLLRAGSFDAAFARCLMVGLACAALGDVLLALPGERAFQTGMGAFWLGHTAYVFATRSALGSDVLPSFVWLVFVPSAVAYAWLFRYLGALRLPVAAYIVVISLMVAYALGLYVARPEQALCFLLGALSFYVSDLSVAQDRFVKPGFLPKLWGLPAYYTGQLLIAWSAGMIR